MTRWGGVNPPRCIFGTKTQQGRAMPSSPCQIGTTQRGGTYPFSPHRNGNNTARRSMPPRLMLWSCVVISSIPNKNNNLQCTLYTRPLIVSTPPLHVPCCPRLLGVFVLLRLCFAGRVALGQDCEQRRDSITPTGNAHDTRQTCVMGTGFLGVRIANPYPYP